MNKQEILKYGLKVFNEEEDKFNRWLDKTNLSLGSITPNKLLETEEGIEQVKNCLDRIEYCNF